MFMIRKKANIWGNYLINIKDHVKVYGSVRFKNMEES
jgi:hypothetical protein